MDENKKRNFKFNMTIFFLIVILIITIVIQYCILDYNKNKEQDLKELSEQNKNLTEINKLEENNIDENNYNKENEILENIFSKDVSSDEQKSIADKLINKIYFKDYVEASIYKVGNFTRETIPNDLILRLGFAKAIEKLEKDQKQINTINDSYDTISKSEVEKEIKELFGNDITYKHDKFINIDVETFNGFYPIRDVVRPGDSEYEFAYIEGGGLDCPQIHQEIYDVIESDNKIELKVKVAFIDIADNSEAGNVLYDFYKSFNFKSDKFENKLITILSDDYLECYGTWYANSYKPNESLKSIIDKLDTYSYIFEKNNETGEYYLSEFHKSDI